MRRTRNAEPLGPLLAPASSTKASDGTCTVNYLGVTRTVYVARDLTVAVGDMLLVDRVGPMWVASCRLFTAAPEANPPSMDVPNPSAATVTGTLAVVPESTGSYRDGAWRPDTTDLVQGLRGGHGNSTGAAFYGAKPASLAGATVTAATVTMTRTAGEVAAAAPTLWLVTETSRPAGAPTRTLSTAGPSLQRGASTTFTLPTAWGQALADGTAGGLAVHDTAGTAYLGYAGRAVRASAFTLTLDWSRTS